MKAFYTTDEFGNFFPVIQFDDGHQDIFRIPFKNAKDAIREAKIFINMKTK